MDLRDPEAEQEYAYRYTVSFAADEDEHEISFITDTANSQQVRRLAWEEFAEMQELAVKTAQEEWRLHRIGVGYADAPWDTLSEAAEMIRELDGVTSARLEKPLEGSWGPVKVIVDVADESAAEARLEELYEPLSLETANGKTVVYPTALPDFSN